MLKKRTVNLKEKHLQLLIVLATFLMVIARILLNEKGRTNPDSIRFMRTAHLLPVVDNTVTPMGYPAAIKLFTFTGLDEFWASKVIGLLAFFFMVYFSWRKKFFHRETVMLSGLFSFVSLFSYTMSEALMLPAVILFLFFATQIINGKYQQTHGFLLLTVLLILLYNIRYPALFIIGASGLYGFFRYRTLGKAFFFASICALLFVILYKFLFIDYFDENYTKNFLVIGMHPTSKLLTELWQGLTTVFNPFIHIANPAGGIVNYGIYGIGALTILLMLFLFKRSKLQEAEIFFLIVAVTGFVCSYFIQYFYSVNPIDYRLMAPFSLPVWLLFFKKLYARIGKLTYSITILSLLTGLVFTWLSRGNYLENRTHISKYLKEQRLAEKPVKFYVTDPERLDEIKVAELISTVNPRVNITLKASDTLLSSTLTKHKVLSKISIKTNRYQ